MSTYLKLLATMACWGGTFIAGRQLAGVVPPLHAAFLRFTLATAILLFLLHRHEGRIPPLNPRQFAAVILLGLTGVLGYNIAFFSGLETVSAGRAGLIIALNPVGIALLSALFGTDPLRPFSTLGVLISVAGAVLVIKNGNPSPFSAEVGIGELTLLGCVLCWSLYSVIGRQAMRGLSPLTAVAYSALSGSLLLAPLALSQGLVLQLPHFGTSAWLQLGYLAVFGTVIGFLWYYQAIKEVGAVRAGVFINFVPLFALLFGRLILKEPLSLSLLQGGTLVLLGTWITNNNGLRLKSHPRKSVEP